MTASRGRASYHAERPMISKRRDRKPENDNYGKLADYVRDAKHTQGQLTRNVPDSTSDPEHGRIA